MGYLHIGPSGFSTAVDDRALAHLKVVMLSALRSGRGISFTLRHDPAVGRGRDTFWIHPGTDLRFQSFGGRAPQLNRAWLRQMAEACKADTGLFLMSEPPDSAAPSPEADGHTRSRSMKETSAVSVERIRLDAETVAEQQTVSDDVRHEEVELVDPDSETRTSR